MVPGDKVWKVEPTGDRGARETRAGLAAAGRAQGGWPGACPMGLPVCSQEGREVGGCLQPPEIGVP